MKFEVNKDYFCRSICDHAFVSKYTILSRTKKMVVVQSEYAQFAKKVKVFTDDEGREYCYPEGKFAFCDVIRA